MDLRFYCLVHAYLSPIQHGIQAGHCAVDLTLKYLGGDDDDKSRTVMEWANHDKTFIVLNGGNSAMLAAAYTAAKKSGYAFEYFEEDADSMRGMMTAVGIVLPKQVYAAEDDKSGNFLYQDECLLYSPESPVYDLLTIVKRSRLA